LSGGNGSGKSTLLKCIYNLLPCWNGSVWFENERIDEMKPSDLIRKGIVYIPQKDFCFENLTVEENLQISGNIYNKTELKQRIAEVLERTELEKLKKRKPFNLSGGEKKLLACSMGFLHQPKLVLFDEPFAGVDFANYQKLISIFKSSFIRDDVAFVFVEHKDSVNNFINRNIRLELGSIIEKI
ncbi:MAG: ATP-binding cassette domain-containing protein, partial [Nanoarchaeota archaeon]|nr:ATP-binding cassette domain-containing protein [Nanoarchaeota archaeon]